MVDERECRRNFKLSFCNFHNSIPLQHLYVMEDNVACHGLKVLNSENLTKVCEVRNAQVTLAEKPQMKILSFHNNNMDILLILDQKSF